MAGLTNQDQPKTFNIHKYLKPLTADCLRNETLYYNLCLCYKYGQYEEAENQMRIARELGLPESEIRAVARSARKSNIANSEDSNTYIDSYKPSKKDFKRPSKKPKPKIPTKDLASEFNKLPDTKEDHPYLKKKQIKPLGIKWNHNLLFIPFSKIESPNFIQSWQTIDREGKKLFKPGERGSSCFQYGTNKVRIYIAEGWATAISIHILTGFAVVACGSKGQLITTAKAIKERYSNSKVVICFDNDGQDSDVKIPNGIYSIKPKLPHNKNKYDYNDYYINDPETAKIELLTLKQKTNLLSTGLNKIVDWLIKGYIPKAALTLLIGDKGAGKTTYCVSVAVEKILETGKRVIYYSNENDPEVVIMNIVMEKVKCLYPESEPSEINKKLNFVRRKFEIFDCENNIIHTHQRVKEEFQHIDSNTYCMVIIDPIADIIEDLASNKEARPIMIALKNIAKNTKVPFLLTLNRKKSIKETELIDQGMGAATIPNVARHVLYIKKVKGQDNISVLFKVASNLGTTDGGILFSYKPGKDESIGCLEVEDILKDSRDDLVKKYVTTEEGRDEIKSEKGIRLQRLIEFLEKGPKQVKEIKQCILQYNDNKERDEDSTKRLIQRDLKEIKAQPSGKGRQVYWYLKNK